MWRNTWNNILQFLSGDVTSATSLVGRAVSAMKDVVKSLWPAFQSVMKTLWSLFRDIWSQFPEIAGFVMGRITRIVVSAALQLQQWLNKEKITWPQVYDGKGWDSEIVKAFSIKEIPFTVLVGSDGTVLGAKLGGRSLEKAIR